MAKRCYYEVLGVARTATETEITKAYRRLAKKYHPDQNPGDDECVAKYHEVQEAYEVLRDPERRQIYDRYGHEGLSRAAAGQSPDARDTWSAVQDLFDAFLGGGRRRSRGPRRGEDIEDVLELTLLEAATGCDKSVTVRYLANCRTCGGSGLRPGTRPTPCRRCRGTGREQALFGGVFAVEQECRSCGGQGAVITDPCPACRGRRMVETTETRTITIPPGVKTHMRLTVPGFGHEGEPGAPRGNLELIVKVREDERFQRDGHNLICHQPITFSRAALGGPIEITTLTGEKVTVEVPRGAQSHATVLRVPGHGMPDFQDPRYRGDLLVVLVVQTPTNLTPEQERLFQQLAELEGTAPGPASHKKGLFGKLKDLVTGETAPTDKKS